MKQDKILILGLGDLGRRLALTLPLLNRNLSLLLASRDRGRGESFARLSSACSTTPQRFIPLDGLDADSLAALLERERPDLIVQAASLMSPWALFQRDDPQAVALRQAGFALQLPAQLPVIRNLMQAVRDSGVSCPVVNCSYPDATHPILERLGLAPTIGIGNAGMILALARRRAADASRPLRVFAHHAHVGAVVRAEPQAARGLPPPLLYLGDERLDAGELYRGPAIPQDQDLNALSAAHALQLIDALLPGAPELLTAAPGPRGLPGGWPVRVGQGAVALDLPAGIQPADMLPYMREAAAGDGLADIAADGTAHFTDALRAALPAPLRELADPMHPDEALPRFQLLQRHLERPAC
ncbi:hypothetical protein [Chromobacterium subtsugae]|uniref:hypothetical protein n=1 Tax=Chromobacterium subtsugae TaxID=251747 RepID=UPI000A775635|nr:hypothetical protein [Chromobacterium subtsugae]